MDMAGQNEDNTFQYDFNFKNTFFLHFTVNKQRKNNILYFFQIISQVKCLPDLAGYSSITRDYFSPCIEFQGNIGLNFKLVMINRDGCMFLKCLRVPAFLEFAFAFHVSKYNLIFLAFKGLRSRIHNFASCSHYNRSKFCRPKT